MPNSPGKRRREQQRADRIARKETRRLERGADIAREPAAEPDVIEADVLDELAALHHSFSANRITLEDFEANKQRLIAQIRVD